MDRRLEEMADRELTEPAAANEGIRRSISAACCGKATNSIQRQPLHPCRPEGWPMTVKNLTLLSGIYHDT